MPRIAYVNGRYLPHDEAQVHIEDRGYQFGDGVYEVIAVRRRRLVDEEPHLDRLDRSLRELRIAWPMRQTGIRHVIREVVRRNRLRDGALYLQVSRGVAPRDQQFPSADTASSLVMTARRKVFNVSQQRAGVAVVTINDVRWGRCDIKTISLVANVLGKQRAVEAGAYEGWQVDKDGYVTEGTTSNAWIVTQDGRLLTRHADSAILNGITRRTILRLAGTQGLAFEEARFSVDQVKAAREAFLTSSTSFVLPVVRIDGVDVNGGRPGTFTRRLQESYERYIDALQPSSEPDAPRRW